MASKRAISTTLFFAVTAAFPYTAIYAQTASGPPYSAQISSDLHLPIQQLTSSSQAFKQERKTQIYFEAVDAYLDNVKLHHPDLFPAFQRFFKEPLPNHDGKPGGFIVYQTVIDDLVSEGGDVSKFNPLNMVSMAGQSHFNNNRPSSKP